MKFNGSGKVLSIEPGVVNYFRLALDTGYSVVVMNISDIDRGKLAVGDEVYVTGNIKGHSSSGRIYNNLFVHNIFKTDERYIIVKSLGINNGISQFQIIRYSSIPVNKDALALEFGIDEKGGEVKIKGFRIPLRSLSAAGLYYNINNLNLSRKVKTGKIKIEGDIINAGDDIVLIDKNIGICPFIFFGDKNLNATENSFEFSIDDLDL